ncbi:MAG: hypothetical protein AB2401_13540, partial [Bacillus sp. (in: firmicutes)]
MVKKIKGLFLVALVFGLLGSVQALAATEEKVEVESKEAHAHKGHFHHSPEFLEKKAKELGISTEGKDSETIATEVREAMIKKKAEELGIKTEGKNFDTLAKEVKETFIKKQAEELGIKTDGKDSDTLAREVRETIIKSEAKELGIST